MTRLVSRWLLVLLLGSVWLAVPARASAQEWPMTQGDVWEVSAVHLKDGGALAYANFLATEWKADQEFAKSKGWIKSYAVLANTHRRKGEPDLFLVTVSERLPTGAETDKRNDEYAAWKKKSQAQMMKESGNRLEMREIGSNSLLQELRFRK